MTAARVIVTRPAREAVRWVADLRAAGLDAVALPLIEIEPAENSDALRDARRRLADYAAVMFVSAAAAEHFFHGSGLVPGDPALRSLRFWATGPGTALALRQAGVSGSVIDAPAADAPQFDSEALWEGVRQQVRHGTRVLIVRGGDAAGLAAGRDWLAREVMTAGGVCDTVVAYRRQAPTLSETSRRIAADAATDASIWLFSSSEAISNLCRAVPAIGWQSARAIATHARIAEAAENAGFGSVRVARPALDGLVASIESFQ